MAEHEPRQIALRLMRNALKATKVDEHVNWPHVATLQPHAMAVVATVDQNDQSAEVDEICNLLGIYFEARGDYGTAQPYLERALAMAEAALGEDHPTTGGRLNNLASLYMSQGRHEEAEPLYVRALANAEAGDCQNFRVRTDFILRL